MNRKQRRTLEAVFDEPVSASITWDDIEVLLSACGAKTIEGKGSAVRFVANGVIARFHRPHPAKEAKRYQVRDARAFLTKLGVVP